MKITWQTCEVNRGLSELERIAYLYGMRPIVRGLRDGSLQIMVDMDYTDASETRHELAIADSA